MLRASLQKITADTHTHFQPRKTLPSTAHKIPDWRQQLYQASNMSPIINKQQARRESWGGMDEAALLAIGASSQRRDSDNSLTSSDKLNGLLFNDSVPNKAMDRRCSWGDMDSIMDELRSAAASVESALALIEETPKEGPNNNKKNPSSRRSEERKKKSRRAQLKKKISMRRIKSMA